MRLTIGFDIDGVLFPWTDVANEALVKKFGIEDPGPHVSWEHLKTRTTQECWQWLWSPSGQDAVFSQVDRIYPAMSRVVNRALVQGHRIHFVTHRDPRQTAVHTTRFLQRHFGAHPWAGVHVVQNSVRKATMLPWDVFVDDKYETCRDLLHRTNAQVFSPVRPWNHGLDGYGGPRLLRYTDPNSVSNELDLRTAQAAGLGAVATSRWFR